MSLSMISHYSMAMNRNISQTGAGERSPKTKTPVSLPPISAIIENNQSSLLHHQPQTQSQPQHQTQTHLGQQRQQQQQQPGYYYYGQQQQAAQQPQQRYAPVYAQYPPQQSTPRPLPQTQQQPVYSGYAPSYRPKPYSLPPIENYSYRTAPAPVAAGQVTPSRNDTGLTLQTPPVIRVASPLQHSAQSQTSPIHSAYNSPTNMHSGSQLGSTSSTPASVNYRSSPPTINAPVVAPIAAPAATITTSGATKRAAPPSDKVFAFISHSPATFPSQEPSIDNAQLARRKRRRTSSHELSILQNEFELGSNPNKARRIEIAGKVKMDEKAVQIWFQNKRQSIKRSINKQQISNIEEGDEEGSDHSRKSSVSSTK